MDLTFILVSHKGVLCRYIVYFGIIDILCILFTRLKDNATLTEVILVAIVFILVMALFVADTAILYKNSCIKSPKKFLIIDLVCVIVTMLYFVLTHILWYAPGEIRFYDILIYATGFTPLLYRVDKIFKTKNEIVR